MIPLRTKADGGGDNNSEAIRRLGWLAAIEKTEIGFVQF